MARKSCTLDHAYGSYAFIDQALRDHAKFRHMIKTSKKGLYRGHYSVMEDGHYRVYTIVEDGHILLLDIKGDKVMHIDRTFYDEGGPMKNVKPILRMQQLIWKNYNKRGRKEN
jgi:hypothetical protein